MLIRPWLLYYRRRLLAAGIFSLLATCLAHMWVNADGWFDFGIFWHTFCGCPANADDACFLLNLPSIMSLIIGVIFAFMSPGGVTTAGVSGTPGGQLKALSRFFLTRPVSRLKTFLLPQAIAVVAITVFPALAFSILVGWLRLVHAPSLHHLMATIRIIPAASPLEPHPMFLQVLHSLNATRRYVAATSVGVSAYAILSSQRSLMLSPNRKLVVLGMVPVFLLYAPLGLFLSGHTTNILLAPGRGMSLTYLPSVPGIALHFGVAVLIAFGCWRIFQDVEL